MNATQCFPVVRPTHALKRKGALTRTPRYPYAISTAEQRAAVLWTARNMSADDKPEWYEQVREHPVLAVFVALGIVAFAAGIASEFAWAQRMIGDGLRWTITLGSLGLVLVLIVASRFVVRGGKRPERRGFEVSQKDKR